MDHDIKLFRRKSYDSVSDTSVEVGLCVKRIRRASTRSTSANLIAKSGSLLTGGSGLFSIRSLLTDDSSRAQRLAMSTTTGHLQTLIDRAKKGDQKARNELLTYSYQRLRRIAHGQLSGRFEFLPEAAAQTDDVTQELYLKLLAEWDSFISPIDSAVHYLNRAAWYMRKVLSDFCRKEFGRLNGPDGLPSRPGKASLETPGADYRGRDLGTSTYDPARLLAWTAFHEEVDRLPEDLKDVVNMRWYHDLDHQEIAGLLGLTEAGVHARWAKARHVLKDRLGNTAIDWTLIV